MKKYPFLSLSLLSVCLFVIQCTQVATKTNTPSAPVLTDESKPVPSMSDSSKLAGTWVLNYITGSRIAFDGLYPNKKPTIIFDLTDNRISGNTSCNSFSGKLIVNGNKIDFTGPIAMTKMMCAEGAKGETVFVETLQKVNTYSISGDSTLNFMMGDMATMRFAKK